MPRHPRLLHRIRTIEMLSEGQLAELIAENERYNVDPDSLRNEFLRKLRLRPKYKNTRPERLLQRAIRKRGLRFRLHVSTLPGKPDLAFYGRARVAVFVDGDFFHGHGKLPLRNRYRWRRRFAEARRRDARHTRALRGKGWAVLRFWGSDVLKDPDQCAEHVRLLVQERRENCRES